MKRKEYYILVIAVVCGVCLLAGCETEKAYSRVETVISPEERNSRFPMKTDYI